MKKAKIRPGVVLISVCDEHILVATREARKKVPYVRQINGAGGFYWRLLEKELEPKEIIRQAATRYRMSDKQAAAAIMSFMKKLYEAGYLIFEDVGDVE